MSIFWWVILVLFFINYSNFIDYASEKMLWNYTKENKKITWLSKIIFPSISIISESCNEGFMLKLLFFGNDSLYYNFNSFSEYWKDRLRKQRWFIGVPSRILFFILMYGFIIVEWFYFILWQVLIEYFIWEIIIRGLIWKIILKGFIWEVLLSGNWLKHLK